jgi:hypothetical protein
MNAQAHGGTAEFRRPSAAPRGRGHAGGVAEDQRVAHGDEWSSNRNGLSMYFVQLRIATT